MLTLSFFISCFLSFSGLRPDALRFFYAYGTLALVSMAAVSFGLYIFITLSQVKNLDLGS